MGTRVPLTVEKIENPTSSPDTIHKFRNRQEPGRDNVGALTGHIERGTLEEVKVESKGIYSIIKRFFKLFLLIDALTKSLEYLMLKKMSADLVDLFAGNPVVITQLANDLFSSYTAVQHDVNNTLSTPADRASKLVESLLAIIEKHPDPSSIVSSITSSLRKVEFIFMAERLEEKLNFSK